MKSYWSCPGCGFVHEESIARIALVCPRCNIDAMEMITRDDFLRRIAMQRKEGKAETVAPDNGGLRFDNDKPRYDLLPPEALMALAELYRVGSMKYNERNWERGMSWGTCFRALMSHSWKFWRGEHFDQETGAHHMIMAAWNAIAIYTYFVRGIGVDDRNIFRREDACQLLWIEPQLSSIIKPYSSESLDTPPSTSQGMEKGEYLNPPSATSQPSHPEQEKPASSRPSTTSNKRLW